MFSLKQVAKMCGEFPRRGINKVDLILSYLFDAAWYFFCRCYIQVTYIIMFTALLFIIFHLSSIIVSVFLINVHMTIHLLFYSKQWRIIPSNNVYTSDVICIFRVLTLVKFFTLIRSMFLYVSLYTNGINKRWILVQGICMVMFFSSIL